MKRLIAKGITVATLVAALAFPLASPAFADQNPSGTGTGPPSQTCLTDATGFVEPGNAANSPGSPFDEPGTNPNFPAGGIGGQNYSPNAQYDVACYQLSH